MTNDQSSSHKHSALAQVLLRFADSKLPEMEDRSGQRRARLAYGQGVEKVLEFARAARSDDGDVYGFGDRARQFQIIAIFMAIAIHAGQQNLSRAQFGRAPRP